MPSSTSWQRYDEEHDVSAILTDAARACVVENPLNVTDYFARYFREVSGGTSIRHLGCREVLGACGGDALAFDLELCTGPEVSITTSDWATAESHTSGGDGKTKSKKDGGGDADGSDDDADADDACDALRRLVQTTLLPALISIGNVEPQQEWDNVLARVLSQSADGVHPSLPWCLSMLAALAAAKQRRVPLYQHLHTLIETQTTSQIIEGFGSTTHSVTNKPSNGNAPTDRGGDVDTTPYAPPRMLVTFLVNDADALAAEAAGQVHFSTVYVGLETLTTGLNAEGEIVMEDGTNAASTPADGATLRRRMRQLHRAAALFLSANAAARVGADGCLYCGGAGSLTEVIRAVTDALEAAGLRPGADVCLGLSLGASKVRVRSGKDGGDAAIVSVTTTAAASVTSNKATVVPTDPSGLYGFFYGEPAITGEQLTEYVKEQFEEIGQGVVQLLMDTHTVDDTVARQRLQLAFQDTVVLAGDAVFDDAGGNHGATYAELRTAAALSGAFPATVVDVPQCASLQTAAQLLRTVAEASNSAVLVGVDAAAGDAEASTHLVDVAVAGRASYIVTRTGPHSAATMAVASRLAAVVTELTAAHAAGPRLPFTRFNATNIPALPEVDVAPIRHKGDKKKKDSRKTSGKKK